MGVGHIAVGLALKKAAPEQSAGLLVFAAYLCDFLFGLFALLGVESFFVPGGYAQLHYLQFDAPFSHGLAGTLCWSALAAVVVRLFGRGPRIALIVGAAVFSHFLLDVLVHVPEIPLLGRNSPKLGLGLWNHLALELSLEVAMAAVAVIVYLRSTRGRGFGGKYGMLILMALLTALTTGTQANATKVPGATAMEVNWILTGIFLWAIFAWMDRKRSLQQSG